ncbi:MAG: RNA-guided endonuclease InsQ/TnpB family protein [Elusimicrobiota bacterium]
MIKTYKFKLYRSRKNKYLNEQTKIAGNIYNHCISLKKRYYKMYGKSLNKFKLQKHLTKLKKLDKYSYWKKVNAQAIQEITDRIERGYKAFFNNCKKKVKTRKVSPPSFKKARNYSSITFKQDGYKILPFNQVKIGKRIYKYWKSREIEGEVKCVTVKKDKLGDWYIYFVCSVEGNSKCLMSISKTGKTAGFDFGCSTFLTQNNGEKIKSPEFFKQSKKQIAKANKKLSRKTKGSNNYKQAKVGLAKLHKKIANRRRDFHFKLANELCDKYDIMLFETLDIQSMEKEHGKKINDLGFSDFVRILEGKALENDKTIYHIDKWFTSTKNCNKCGYKNNNLTERDRTWVCPECSTKHDRDINAAINIINKGINELEFKQKDGASSCWREDVSLGECQAVFARS